MQCLGTDTSSPGPWWGMKEQTKSVNIPLMTGTGVFHNSGILTFEGNLVLCVQACGNGNIFPALAG